MELSLCITNYNRTDLLLESFWQVVEDPRISEIIICDDGSDMWTIEYITRHLTETRLHMNKIKFRLHPNDNVGMYMNKRRAVSYASNEWCILFDSDNILTPSYLDAFFRQVRLHQHAPAIHSFLNEGTIFCPDFAMPQFNYKKYAGHYYDRDNVVPMMDQPMFECLMNTCNYIVHKETYLSISIENLTASAVIGAADTITFNYEWLSMGGQFFVVPGMEYMHRVHKGSGFMQDVDNNMKKVKYLKSLIQKL